MLERALRPGSLVTLPITRFALQRTSCSRGHCDCPEWTPRQAPDWELQRTSCSRGHCDSPPGSAPTPNSLSYRGHHAREGIAAWPHFFRACVMFLVTEDIMLERALRRTTPGWPPCASVLQWTSCP